MAPFLENQPICSEHCEHSQTYSQIHVYAQVHKNIQVFPCLPGIHMFLSGLTFLISLTRCTPFQFSASQRHTKRLPLHSQYKDWTQPPNRRHAHHRACNTTHYWARRVQRAVMGETSTTGRAQGARTTTSPSFLQSNRALKLKPFMYNISVITVLELRRKSDTQFTY